MSPALAAISSWISGSGSARAERRVELDQHELGHRQAERAGQLPGHDLRRQRLRTLARAAELEDVEAVVVGLDDAPGSDPPSRSGVT